MAWRVTVRNGPRVEKLRAAALEEALDLVEREGRALAAGPGRRTVDLRARTFTPQQQVAGRVELAGPGVRAGVDVRGDGDGRGLDRPGPAAGRRAGGRASRPYEALRRVLAQSFSVEP